MQALVPPQMIEIEAVGAIAILQEKRCITPMSAASGHGPRSCASISDASSAPAAMWRNILKFHALAMALSKADALHLQERMEAHHPHADRAFAHRRIFRPRHFRRGAVDVILQDVVEEAHDILDEAPVLVPFVPGFKIERRQAANRGAIVAEMIDARSAG